MAQRRLRPHTEGRASSCSFSSDSFPYPQSKRDSQSNVVSLLETMTDTGEGDDEFQFLRTVSQTRFRLNLTANI